MKRFAFVLMIGLAIAPRVDAHGGVPARTGYVTDRAHVLDELQRSDLDLRLARFHARTGIEVAVLLVVRLDGVPLEKLARKAVRSWTLGGGPAGNAVLVSASVSERRIRIQRGRALEPTLSARDCRRVAAELIKPEFKRRQYYEGLAVGLDALLNQISPEPVASATPSPLSGAPPMAADPAPDAAQESWLRNVSGKLVMHLPTLRALLGKLPSAATLLSYVPSLDTVLTCLPSAATLLAIVPSSDTLLANLPYLVSLVIVTIFVMIFASPFSALRRPRLLIGSVTAGAWFFVLYRYGSLALPWQVVVSAAAGFAIYTLLPRLGEGASDHESAARWRRSYHATDPTHPAEHDDFDERSDTYRRQDASDGW